jgi:sugar O-acyltransferase (sialic acid O-acetyltransferase NeuD family)
MQSEDVPLCCFGAGGHGKAIASQWARLHGGQVWFADERLALGTRVAGFAVRFGDISEVAGCQLLVTIGDNAVRSARQSEAAGRGIALATFVADPEHYFTEPPGAGTTILAGAVVNCDARLGKGVIVNTNATVEHDCVVDDFVHIAPCATLAGDCHVGAMTLVGTGASVLPGIEIAAGVVIGAGAVVTKDLAIPGIYVGAPARRVG